MKFKKITRAEIEGQLLECGKHVLVAPINHESAPPSFDDTEVKITVISFDEENWAPSRCMRSASAYNYVVDGMLEYRDLETGEVIRFCTGDFYQVLSGARYVIRRKRGTRLISFELRPQEEAPTPATTEDLSWAGCPLTVTRTDRSEQHGQQPNSLIPAGTAAIVDATGRLLLVKRRDNARWAMPGGVVEINESLETCIKREVWEETGLDIEVEGVVGTYTDPNNVACYDDGEIRREFNILFLARPITSAVILDSESIDWRWAAFQDIQALSVGQFQLRRIQDVQAYLVHRQTYFR